MHAVVEVSADHQMLRALTGHALYRATIRAADHTLKRYFAAGSPTHVTCVEVCSSSCDSIAAKGPKRYENITASGRHELRSDLMPQAGGQDQVGVGSLASLNRNLTYPALDLVSYDTV